MFRNVQSRSRQVLPRHASASRAVGCDHEALRDHIEGQFTVGMYWGNYGQWEVKTITAVLVAERVPEHVCAAARETGVLAFEITWPLEFTRVA